MPGTANARDNALKGKFWLEGTVEALYPEWARMVQAGLIKNPSSQARLARGHGGDADDYMANAAIVASLETSNETHEVAAAAAECQTASSDDGESDATTDSATANLLSAVESIDPDLLSDDLIKAMAAFGAKPKRKVGIDDVCGACGGRGHWVTVNGKKCLTVVLGNKVPLQELQETKYPRNIKFPTLGRGTKDRLRGASSSAEASAITSRPKHKPTARSHSPGRSPRKPHFQKKRPFKGKAKVIDSNEPPQTDASEESEESDSESGNLVHSLAVNFDHLTVTPPPSPPDNVRAGAPRDYMRAIFSGIVPGGRRP